MTQKIRNFVAVNCSSLLAFYIGLRAANRLSKFKLRLMDESEVDESYFKENFSTLLDRFYDEVVEEMLLDGWFQESKHS